MCCVAAVAAGIPDIVDKARGAARIAVIDGCDHECAKKVMNGAGFTNLAHVELGALGMEKGKTPPPEERVASAAAHLREALAGE